MLVADLLAVDPVGLGVHLRAGPGPLRDRWLERLRGSLPASTPMRRMPPQIGDDRLLGGLDLTATLASGRPVAARGMLAEIDGGVLVLAMAERLPTGTAAKLLSVFDEGRVHLVREGFDATLPAHFGIVALDESRVDDDAQPPAALLQRLSLRVMFDALPMAVVDPAPLAEDVLCAARASWRNVDVDGATVEALCVAAVALGITNVRAALAVVRVAKMVAAIDGRAAVEAEDAVVASRLVLAPLATQLPAPPEESAEPEPQPPADEPPPETSAEDTPSSTPDQLDERVLEAALAALPPGMLEQLARGARQRQRNASAGREGVARAAPLRGRPAGIRAGEPRNGQRLHLLATLRAAAPWQRVRQRDATDRVDRLAIRRDDLRIQRLKQPAQRTTVFAVDASGSAALHRLAEAKGAVELLLAECYVRRDQVALVAFRGTGAEVLLPPTRSLTRAKRSLAGLPGGGGTPLASGIEAAFAMAAQLRRRGGEPVVVLLTDGKANIALGGAPGRPQAEQDAERAARVAAQLGVPTVLIDTSPRPQPLAQRLAHALAARYVALPYADAGAMARAIQRAEPAA